MNLSVGIAINNVSYTPEAYAYEEFLTKKGFDVQLSTENLLDPLHDFHIYFMGIKPFWKARGPWKEIHEYQSLSLPRLAVLKDLIKKNVNRSPDGRIFLNEVVKEKLKFNDRVPSICRDMGVDSAILAITPNKNPEFDIVYCGSIRPGLDDVLTRLATLGLKIMVIGRANQEYRSLFQQFPNILFTGAVKRSELPNLYSNARIGLNYTPDLYPFNIQTSTKVLEYCAAGLGVLSNRYAWTEAFASTRNFNFLWLEDVTDIRSFEEYRPGDYNVEDLRWESVLEGAKLHDFLMKLL